MARALTLLGGDALKLQQRTAALLANLPNGSIRASCMRSAMPWALSDRTSLAAFVDSVDRWISERLRVEGAPMRTCRALRGWRRYGKRSPAPHATPKTIILSENRWFSRCSRCLRKRRGRRCSYPFQPSRSSRPRIFAVAKKSSKKKKTGKAAKRAADKAATKKRAVKKARKTSKKAAKKPARKAAKKSTKGAAKKPPRRRLAGRRPRRPNLRITKPKAAASE